MIEMNKCINYKFCVYNIHRGNLYAALLFKCSIHANTKGQ